MKNVSLVSLIAPLVISLMIFDDAFIRTEKGPTKTGTMSAKNWPIVKLEHFSFSRPPEMKPISSRGIDSAIWKYSSSTLDLTVDLGIYSELPPDMARSPDCRKEHRTINGKKGILVFCPNIDADAKSHPYIAAAYFTNIGLEELKLSFFARCASLEDRQVARRIFLSIRFGKTHRKR